MGKGFLSRLIARLAGEGYGERFVLRPGQLQQIEKQCDDAPFVRLGDFMEAYRAQAERAPSFYDASPAASAMRGYVRMLTGLQAQMVQGRTPFFYPGAGVYDYPEDKMFFADHCFLPVATLTGAARALQERGDGRGAFLCAAALGNVIDPGARKTPQALEAQGYVLGDGVHALRKYYLSVYEHGASFAPVLRLRDQAALAAGPKGPGAR